MIQSWRGRWSEPIFRGELPKGFPADLASRCRRKLQAIDAAMTVSDLRNPPGNRLHLLSGDRDGQWAISINDQFHICFRWGPSGPEDLEIVDYH